MVIEKLNSNTLKIVLTIEELSVKNITIRDIENGKKKAQNFFFDIIEDSRYASDFLKEDTKLLVEASISQDNKLVVTITKVTVPDICETKPVKAKGISSKLYLFKNLKDLYSFTTISLQNSLYLRRQ